MKVELCAMFGPALRDKHGVSEPTFADGTSGFSATAVESEIRPGARWRRRFSRKVWFDPLVDVACMLVPQSRAKHGTQNSQDPVMVMGRMSPTANDPGHPFVTRLSGVGSRRRGFAIDSRIPQICDESSPDSSRNE